MITEDGDDCRNTYAQGGSWKSHARENSFSRRFGLIAVEPLHVTHARGNSFHDKTDRKPAGKMIALCPDGSGDGAKLPQKSRRQKGVKSLVDPVRTSELYRNKAAPGPAEKYQAHAAGHSTPVKRRKFYRAAGMIIYLFFMVRIGILFYQ